MGIEKRTMPKVLREGRYLSKMALKQVPHALTEVEKWTRYVMYHLRFFKSTLFIHPRAPNTIQFHLYISTFLHDLSILPKNIYSCHGLIPNPLLYIYIYILKKIKSVAYSSQGSHTGQLDFCN